ncbi:MAG: M67 family metallopeptidase [Gammaproteobacteria bacterium]|nr:M67 family metallopeptidase [Gammaproteobacteria bacterium]
MKTINIPRTIANKLLTLAQIDSENEICGLIGAKDGRPVHVYPVENIALEKQHFFEMNPAKQIAAIKSMRERGEELFAIFHSHPDAPAKPSTADMEQAAYPEALYLIISLNTKGVLDMRGFYLGKNSVEDVELII